MDHYLLIGQTPVPEPDLITWAQTFETMDRRVMYTRVLDLCDVSTVFLGLDHRFMGEGPPLLFETMAFWRGRHGDDMLRSSTWDEAERMHARMVRAVSHPLNVWRYVCSQVHDAFRNAKEDLKTLWRTALGQKPTELDTLYEQMKDRIKADERW